jgi:hypothetical protein
MDEKVKGQPQQLLKGFSEFAQPQRDYKLGVE